MDGVDDLVGKFEVKRDDPLENELNFFNYDEPNQEMPFELDYDENRIGFGRSILDDRYLPSTTMTSNQKQEVKKSISYGHFGDFSKNKPVPKTGSCLNLQELKNHPVNSLTKPNAKNVFIQKIKSLLSDTNLRDKIQSENK